MDKLIVPELTQSNTVNVDIPPNDIPRSISYLDFLKDEQIMSFSEEVSEVDPKTTKLRLDIFSLLIILDVVIFLILYIFAGIKWYWLPRLLIATWLIWLAFIVLGAELQDQLRSEKLFHITRSKIKEHKTYTQIGCFAFFCKLQFVYWINVRLKAILFTRYLLALLTVTILIDFYTDVASIYDLLYSGDEWRILWAIILCIILFMALRIRLIKHLMAFSKKPILNRPRTLLSIYLPFGFFP